MYANLSLRNIVAVTLLCFSSIAYGIPRSMDGIESAVAGQGTISALRLVLPLGGEAEFPNTDAGRQSLLDRMNSVPGENYGLVLVRPDRSIATSVSFDAADGSVTPRAPGTRNPPPTSTPSSVAACNNLLRTNPPKTTRSGSGKPEDVTIVFNEFGSLCYQSHVRVTEGDNLKLVTYAPSNVANALNATVDTCSLEPSTPIILDSVPDGFTPTSGPAAGGVIRREFVPLQCFDSAVTVSIKKGDGSVFAGPVNIKQYQRYRGTFQVGAVWTDLTEDGFDVTDFGAGPVIRELGDGNTGPEYVGSLVVYGIPHYVRNVFQGGGNYAGRDIVNENSWQDRLGLALSFGLSDPDELLGIGLSFELVSGINLTGTVLYRNIDVLDTFEVGDSFTGTAQDIPTKRSWENEFVIGLSIDARYLTKFFTNSSD